MMLRVAVQPVMPMVRVLQVMLWLLVSLVMPMVRVLPGVVLGVGLCVGGRWSLLGVAPHHSWQRTWRAALLAGLLLLFIR